MLVVVSKYDIINKGGSLTLTSGTGGMKPGVTASVGGSLNAGLFTMTQGLANELTEKKIRVNCRPKHDFSARTLLISPGVVPGMVITELWDKMGQSKEQQKGLFEKTASKLPVGFVATPEDVGRTFMPFRRTLILHRSQKHISTVLEPITPMEHSSQSTVVCHDVERLSWKLLTSVPGGVL